MCIGPFDLAKQMGVERGGEEHEAAIARILKAAKGAGKTAAFFCKFDTYLFLFSQEPWVWGIFIWLTVVIAR